MDKTTDTETAGEARDAAVSYLSQQHGRRMVVTSEAIRHLRGNFPLLATSDRQLTDMVAEAAISLGLDVELDGGPRGEILSDRRLGKAANSNQPR